MWGPKPLVSKATPFLEWLFLCCVWRDFGGDDVGNSRNVFDFSFHFKELTKAGERPATRMAWPKAG